MGPEVLSLVLSFISYFFVHYVGKENGADSLESRDTPHAEPTSIRDEFSFSFPAPFSLSPSLSLSLALVSDNEGSRAFSPTLSPSLSLLLSSRLPTRSAYAKEKKKRATADGKREREEIIPQVL
jgi:hypothetical protein